MDLFGQWTGNGSSPKQSDVLGKASAPFGVSNKKDNFKNYVSIPQLDAGSKLA